MPIDPTRRPALLPIPGQQQSSRPMFRSLGIAASGLSAQRQRMETIAQNMANADVTRGPDGQPYKRKDVVMEAATSQNACVRRVALEPSARRSGWGVLSQYADASINEETDDYGPQQIAIPRK